MRPFLYAGTCGQNNDALIVIVDREEFIIKDRSYYAFTCRDFPEFVIFSADANRNVDNDLEQAYQLKEGYIRTFWLIRLSETKEGSQEGWLMARERCS